MTTEQHPLRDALETAVNVCQAAYALYVACECAEKECVCWHEYSRAHNAVESAREALIEGSELRTWVLREEGYDYDEIRCKSARSALRVAKANVDSANYNFDEGQSTLWVRVEVFCPLTEEKDSATVQLDPDEPDCTADGKDHDWRSPVAIVGGIEENPGVWGHGGGVRIQEVCMRCGCGKLTDTWAQNPNTGEQGLTSIEYEPGKYSDEIDQSDV